MTKFLRTMAIGLILLGFFSVPIAFVLYGAAGGLGGLIVIGLLIGLQLPVLLILKRLVQFPRTPRDDES